MTHSAKSTDASDQSAKDDEKKGSLKASSANETVDLERGATLGSLDAGDIPIPTTLQRNVPRPGAFGQPGPGMDDPDDSSSPSLSSPVTNDTDILVTAHLVVEDDGDDEEAPARAVVAVAKPKLVHAVPATPEEGFAEEPTKRKRSPWTRRTKLIAFAVGVLVLGVVIGSLSFAVANKNSGDANSSGNKGKVPAFGIVNGETDSGDEGERSQTGGFISTPESEDDSADGDDHAEEDEDD